MKILLSQIKKWIYINNNLVIIHGSISVQENHSY